MNEQERLEQIMDILIDSTCDMCHCNRFDRDDCGPDHVEIQHIAKEIMAIFQQQQKETRSKREQLLDAQFACMGIKPRVYHFTEDIEPFKCVTIADMNILSRESARLMVVLAMQHIYFREHEKATHFLAYMKTINRNGVYGIAICDKSNTINKRYGRNKAKGKLIQHLLEEEKCQCAL